MGKLMSLPQNIYWKHNLAAVAKLWVKLHARFVFERRKIIGRIVPGQADALG